MRVVNTETLDSIYDQIHSQSFHYQGVQDYAVRPCVIPRCPTLLARGVAIVAIITLSGVDRARPGFRGADFRGRIPYVSGMHLGELVSIPDAGHAVMLDNPGALAAQILSFLDEHSALSSYARCGSVSAGCQPATR